MCAEEQMYKAICSIEGKRHKDIRFHKDIRNLKIVVVFVLKNKLYA